MEKEYISILFCAHFVMQARFVQSQSAQSVNERNSNKKSLTAQVFVLYLHPREPARDMLRANERGR